MENDELIRYITSYQDKWVQIRHDLHKIPELAKKEFMTQRYIMNYLDKLGIENRVCGVTGVYAILRTGCPGNTVAFRADIDALPLYEQTGMEYASVHSGCMHACGHDVHTTFLLGLAQVLKTFEDKLCGNIVFLFQPAEETTEGAQLMINDKALEDPEVDSLFAAHIWNMPFGKILVKQGPIMASPVHFELNINGKGGHGAQPHLCSNPISAAAHIISAFEGCAATMIDPMEPLVVSVCSIHGGDCDNAIPSTVKLTGTIRTFSDDICDQVLKKLICLAKNIVEAYNADFSFNILSRTPATINDGKLASWAYNELKDVFGNDMVIDDMRPAMTGEDFAIYGQKVPSLFLWIGMNNNDKSKVFNLHNDRFDIDERILSTGITAFAKLAFGKCN